MAIVNHMPAALPRRLPATRGITAAMQARISAGLMSARLPWPVAVYLFCVVLPIWFNAGPLLLSMLRLFLLVMIVPVMLRLLTGLYGRVIATDWLFVVFTLWMGISLSISSPSVAVTQFGSEGMEFLGGYAIARAYVRTPEVFLALCRALVLIVLCLLPFAIFETLTDRSPIIELVWLVPGLQSFWITPETARLGLERVQGPFAHPIHFGLFCSFAFSLAFVALKGVVSDARRWVSAALVASTGFLALSSGAWLAILLQAGLIFWAAAFARIAWRWWLLTGLIVLAYVVIDLLSNRTPIQVFMSYATFSAHNAYWRSIIFEWGIANILGSAEKGIPASPVLGIGMGDWIRPIWMHSGSVDNFWLVVGLRYGVPGFLLIALGYLLVLGRVIARDFTADPVLSQIRLAWVFTFLGMTFTLCTVHVWSTIYSFTFFIFGTGVWLIMAQPAQALSKQEAENREEHTASRTGRAYSRYPVVQRRPDHVPRASLPTTAVLVDAHRLAPIIQPYESSSP